MMFEYTVKIHDDGSEEWQLDGLIHREDGPAIYQANGNTKKWYKKGVLHREDGPAIEYDNGTKYWYYCGKIHREDGPAVMYPDGCTEYWLKDTVMSVSAHDKAMAKDPCEGKMVEIDGVKYKLQKIE